MKYKRIILAEHGVETLSYFSYEIKKACEKSGRETFVWDLEEPEKSRQGYEKFVKPGETLFLTFNFIGLSEEKQFEWDETESVFVHDGVDMAVIMVDHPMYYYKQLGNLVGQKVRLFAIDRDHVEFLQEFYPSYQSAFLPLGGTELPGEKIPWKKRKIDVVFTGNYVPLERLCAHLEGVEEENRAFYFEIIEDLIKQSSQTMDGAILKHLRKEFPEIGRQETLACLYGMIFIDLYVRSYFREKIICTLAEQGIKVVLLGKDWEMADCKCPENFILKGQTDSQTCLEVMRDAKIAVNIMPWFKDGIHDRVLNGMLQGCVVVTDFSKYMSEILTDGKDCVAYSLEKIEELPGKIKELLGSKEAEKIAEQGWAVAKQHTWEKRMEKIDENYTGGCGEDKRKVFYDGD